MCLTCGARARSVVEMKVVRTRHGRSAEMNQVVDVDEQAEFGLEFRWTTHAFTTGQGVQEHK